MAENLGQAVLELDTKDRKFTRGINKAGRLARNLDLKFNQVSRSIDRLGGRLQGLGKRLAIFVTAPILAVGFASVKTASDIQELNNLTEVTFGESTKAVLKWSKEIGAAVGRSSFRLQEAATQFAAFLKPLGVAPQQIAPMSKALGLLVTDISSFRNLAEERVFVSLFSGLAGETEAVRRLGIDIGQAAVNQELLNLGLKGNVENASQAQKVLARFNLVVRQTRDAQGDAARTALSFENQTRALTDSLRDARVKLGEELLPVTLKLVTRLRQLTQGFLQLSPHIQSQIILYAGLAAIIAPIVFILGTLIRAVGFVLLGFGKLAKLTVLVSRGLVVLATVGFSILVKTISSTLKAVGQLARKMLFLLSPIVLIPLALAAAGAGFVVFKDTIVAFAQNLISALKKEFVEAFNNKIVVPFQEAINSLIDFLPKKVTDFLGLEPIQVEDIINNSFTDDFKATMEQAKKDAADSFTDFKNNASRAIGDIQDLLGNILPEKKNIKAAFTNFERNITDAIEKAKKLLKDLLPAEIPLPGLGDIPPLPETLPLTKLTTQVKNLDNAFAAMGATFTSAFEEAILGGERLSNILGGLLKDIARIILRAAILDPLSAGIAGGIKSLFGREHGGRVRAGQSVVVGEKRAEVFRPDTAGRIIPSIAGGGVNVTLQIDASGADPSVLANMMRLIEARLIPQAIEGARSAVFSDLSRPEFA